MKIIEMKIKDNLGIIALILVSLVPPVLKGIGIIDTDWYLTLVPLCVAILLIISSVVWVAVGLIIDEINKTMDDYE